MTTWHEVAQISDLHPETPKALVVGGEAIGLYLIDGAPLAIGNICPHQRNILLSDGWLEDGIIECPMHQSQFEIRTGKCLGPPATEDVPTYPTKVEGTSVLVGIV